MEPNPLESHGFILMNILTTPFQTIQFVGHFWLMLSATWALRGSLCLLTGRPHWNQTRQKHKPLSMVS